MELLGLTGKSGPEDFWILLVVLMAVGVGYLANKITNGLSFGYRKIPVGNTLKATLTSIHIFGSVITAFILPNNYFSQFGYFQKLYKQNQLWIPASMLMLFFVLLMIVGTFATLIAKRWIKNR